MKKSISLLACLILMIALCSSAFAAEFSADMIQTMNGNQMQKGKIYVKGDLMRTDTNMNGMNAAMITDLKGHKVIMLQPQNRMYMEMQFDPARAGAAALKESSNEYGAWRTVGRETVDGWDCEKRVFDYKDKSMGELTAWFADKLGYPVKTYHKGPQGVMTIEYKNIKTGAVDATVFDIPAGFQKMTIPNMGQPGMRPGKPPTGQ